MATRMRPITVEEAKKIATKGNVQPAKVKNTTILRFTDGKNKRLDIIGWDEFEKILESKKLTIYESGGYMKIMKR